MTDRPEHTGEAVMAKPQDPVFLARFCGQCNCGCPELYVDPGAAPERQVVLTDDFGQRVEMSLGQFQDIVRSAKDGTLDHLLDRQVAAAVEQGLTALS
jgi:hypothetical protein